MLELALVACLADDLTRCRDVALIFSEEAVTPMQCMIGAQPQIAKYVEEHPRWVVKKWSCRPAGRIAKI